jgi:L-ascorbate metabolism protein UlaG (beta-lactamase superfamily)
MQVGMTSAQDPSQRVTSLTTAQPEERVIGPRVTFVGHATVLVETGGLRILTDPLLTDRLAFIRRVVDPVAETSWSDLDLVLISHLHHDHLHLASLRQIAPGTPVIAPRGAAPIVRRGQFDDIVEVVAGDRVVVGDVTISVVPALHADRRIPLGRRAQPVGYLIESADASCYFAGDTDLFDDMRLLAGRVRVALVPVWGWGTSAGDGHLDPVRAAAAVELIRPATVVPIHWGTLWPIGIPDRRGRLVLPPLELVESLGRLGVRADVHVLRPGGTLPIAPDRPR